MCNCGAGVSGTPQTVRESTQQYEVKLPNGRTEIVSSDHEARVLITQSGGGTFSRL